MPSKKEDKYSVLYLDQEIENCENKVLVAPSSWIKESYVIVMWSPELVESSSLNDEFTELSSESLSFSETGQF